MFEGCSSLNMLYLSFFDTKNVENMNSVFANCSSLTKIENNFRTDKAISLKKMFHSCVSLTELHLNYFDTSKIEQSGLESVFDNCTNLNLFIDVDKCSNLVKLIPEYVNVTDI